MLSVCYFGLCNDVQRLAFGCHPDIRDPASAAAARGMAPAFSCPSESGPGAETWAYYTHRINNTFTRTYLSCHYIYIYTVYLYIYNIYNSVQFVHTYRFRHASLNTEVEDTLQAKESSVLLNHFPCNASYSHGENMKVLFLTLSLSYRYYWLCGPNPAKLTPCGVKTAYINT
jgi:hypothetical protein